MRFKGNPRMKKVTVRVAAKKSGPGKHKGYTKKVYKAKK
jgi:hypothetical protein